MRRLMVIDGSGQERISPQWQRLCGFPAEPAMTDAQAKTAPGGIWRQFSLSTGSVGQLQTKHRAAYGSGRARA